MSWAPKISEPPEGYRFGGRYRPTLSIIARGIAYIMLGKPRSLAHDALYASADMPAAPLVRGADLVPEHGPFVVTANHYERPGLWMAWPALLVSHIVRQRTAQDVHWVAIETWESFSFHGIPIPPELIRVVFERAFNTYGIIAMSPPDAPAAARARSIREVAAIVKSGEIVGLMPEGTVGATPELLGAMEGVGAFLLLLSTTGAPIVPVGLFEENERLVAQIGDPYRLETPRELPRDERDSWARRRVMTTIRDLLPEPLHGAWRQND